MRPTLVVLSVVSALSFGVSCSASPSASTPATTAAAATPTPAAAVPESLPFAPAASEQSGRWRVVNKQNPMNDAAVVTATSRATGAEGTYELEFTVANDSLTVDYTIYDAEPLGLQPSLNGTDISFHKNLQWRFDKTESSTVVADRNKEYSNRFRLTSLDDAFARLGATNTRTTWGALTSAKTIVIQGLRDPGEYLEFPLDASFDPFRTVVGTLGATSAPRIEAAIPKPRVQVGTRGDKENLFMLNGFPTDPEVQGELELTIEKEIPFKKGWVFLLKNKGGTQCPTSYYIVFKHAAGTTVTPEFGTCAVLSALSEKDGSLVMTMPSTPPTTYSFDGATLLENGKPVKD